MPEAARLPEPETGAVITTAEGEERVLNTDSSLVPTAGPGDICINGHVWQQWEAEFDNHVVFGEGTNTVHRFYNNAPGRTSEEMRQPGVIAPFGEPNVEIRGNVLVDTAATAVYNSAIMAGTGTDVNLTNIIWPASASGNVVSAWSSGTATGGGPITARWMQLHNCIANGTIADNQLPTTRDAIFQWVGWNTVSRNYIRLGDFQPQPYRERPGYRRDRIARQNRRNTAQMRAERLLWSILDRDQRREWRRDGTFHVQVGPRRYRIHVAQRTGNVELVDRNGEVIRRYCCHVSDLVPDADNALAQMMTLLHDEDGFLKLANVHFDRERQASGSITVGNAGVYNPNIAERQRAA